MNRFLLCSAAALLSLQSLFGVGEEPVSAVPNAAPNVAPNTVPNTMPSATGVQTVTMPQRQLAVCLKVEPLSEAQQKLGLTVEALQADVAQELEKMGIIVNNDLAQPVLTLRVRTIQSGLDYATFFQLSLQEESMLIRNRSTFNAVTWSQASLLSCRPESLQAEVQDTVRAMSQTFAKDFSKALQVSI